MKKYSAELVFSNVSLHNSDPRRYSYLLYKCPKCDQQISFSYKDFQRYALNQTPKYKGLFPDLFVGNYNSFLEFICPECKIKTRVYYGIYFGDKYPCVKIDSVLTSE
jgi:phage FluMu protein Com